MRFQSTPRQEELEKIYEPYLVGCHFREDTPEDVLAAFEEWKDIDSKIKLEEVKSWFE